MVVHAAGLMCAVVLQKSVLHSPWTWISLDCSTGGAGLGSLLFSARKRGEERWAKRWPAGIARIVVNLVAIDLCAVYDYIPPMS